MSAFFISTWDILLALAPWLLLGAFVAGVLHVLLPADFLRKQLTGRAGVLKAVGLGVPLPLCSCGVIPVGLQLKKSGASNGAIVAFLISTPQTGADSILVSASMLGWPFAIFKVLSAAVTGIVGGWLTDTVGNGSTANLPQAEEPIDKKPRGFADLLEHSLELLRSIWGWLVLGILVSAAIEVFVPPQAMESLSMFGGLVAMLVTLAIALPLYVCATASVPIAAALVASGLPTGAALVFLMAGPATNVATLGALFRALGGKALTVYLATIIIGSIACGWAFGFVIDTSQMPIGLGHEMHTWWTVASAVVLVALLARFAWDDALRLKKGWTTPAESMSGPRIKIGVQGMTCNNCVAKLERQLIADDQIDSATVTLEPGLAVVHGRANEARIRNIVERAGFRPD